MKILKLAAFVKLTATMACVGLLASACGTDQGPGQHEQVAQTGQNLSKCGTPPGTNGDGDYCSANCQCIQGEGDCDGPTHCVAPLKCSALGVNFGLLYPGVNVCAPAHCNNNKKDGDETSVDVGGSCGSQATCTDGVRNGDETGVDCGGSVCPACPTCSDGIMNQDETGVDCGGSVCPECPSGTCSDGIQNQDETGVDCGGVCPACPPGESCSDGILNQDETGVDCGGVCPACPTCSDGIQNQDETGVDCGGSTCPACPTPQDLFQACVRTCADTYVGAACD